MQFSGRGGRAHRAQGAKQHKRGTVAAAEGRRYGALCGVKCAVNAMSSIIHLWHTLLSATLRHLSCRLAHAIPHHHSVFKPVLLRPNI